MSRGTALSALVKDMQKLNEEIAALLRTFERLSGERGFINTRGSQITKDCSTSIESPEYWTPPWMYRVLNGRKNADEVLILNVILDNPEDTGLLPEPMALCARFEYARGKAKEHTGEWDPWDIWSSEHVDVGRAYRLSDLNLKMALDALTLGEWGRPAADAIRSLSFVSTPLAELTDTKTLKAAILDRVLSKD